MLTRLDPKTVKPLAGKAVIRITEVLGGEQKSGLFIPGTTQDHGGKDTMYGELMAIGPAPTVKHKKFGPGPGWEVVPNDSGRVWSEAAMAEFQVGDIYVFPRDVELAFVWENHRYAIVHLHEAILRLPREGFEGSGFEVVPWVVPSERFDDPTKLPVQQGLEYLEDTLSQIEREGE